MLQIWSKLRRLAARFGVALSLVGTVAVEAGDNLNIGPLYDKLPLTLNEGHRTEAAGPLFYREQKETQRTFAVPPLFCDVVDAGTDSHEFDILYPVLTYDRFGTEYRWQLFQLLSLSGGENMDGDEKDRFTIFPFYFQQRSTDPQYNYTALAPIYGHLQNRLFRDRIFFVMFPIYGQSQKRDVITDNYLYPFFHLRRGNELRGWQFWPLIGDEHKGITWRTNGFGDVELIGGHDKFFALWPIYFNQETGIGTTNPATTVAALPLFSVTRSPLRDSTSVLWPFFNVIDDRGKKYREWEVPWPFIVIARGEGKTTTRFFPLFSRAENATHQSNFYLWPIYKYNRVHSDPLDRERTRILFFLYSDVNEKNTATGKIKTRNALWPLFTHYREFDGSTRLQLLAPLEPILPGNKSIERNYSPLWSVWRSEKNGANGDASQSFLWNLFRREVSGDDKKYSLLFGLFQYQSTERGKRLKLFYIPVNGRGEGATVSDDSQ